MQGSARSAHTCSLVGDSVSVNPHGLLDSVDLLVVFLTLTDLLTSIFHSSSRLPELYLMFGCGTLHLSPSDAEGRLSRDILGSCL